MYKHYNICNIPIYFCNIHMKQLQYNSKTSETLEIYAWNMRIECNIYLLLVQNGGSSIQSLMPRSGTGMLEGGRLRGTSEWLHGSSERAVPRGEAPLWWRWQRCPRRTAPVPEKVSDGWAAWWSWVRRSNGAVDKATMGNDGWGISVLFFNGEPIWTDGCPQ
jgi:hypothetical protein